jgi:hypothetical protein
MAFTEGMVHRSSGIDRGDGLIVYVSRGAFHNPHRDVSQVVAVARIESPPVSLRRPLKIAGRTFVVKCDLSIESSLPERGGVPIKPLVARLHLVKHPEAWGQYFRQGLIEIDEQDFRFLARQVRTWAAMLGKSTQVSEAQEIGFDSPDVPLGQPVVKT